VRRWRCPNTGRGVGLGGRRALIPTFLRITRNKKIEASHKRSNTKYSPQSAMDVGKQFQL